MDDPGIQKNLGPVFSAVDIVAFTLSTALVILRLGTRVFITRNPGWDDATILLAQAITGVGKGLVVTEVSYGLGQHRSQLSKGKYQHYLKFDFLDWAQFFTALLVTKISICLFLLRLSQFNRLRAILYGLIGFLVITHIPLFFIYVFQCSPIRKAWDRESVGKCLSLDIVKNVIIAQGVFSILTDFLCATFPAVLLWNVRIRTKTKIGVCLLMGAGVVTGCISIARTSFAWQIKSENISWVGIPGALTRVFEVNIGIMAACAPVLRPFVRYVRARLTGEDPHHMLRQNSTKQSFHSSWYYRFWPSRSSPDRSLRHEKNVQSDDARHKCGFQQGHASKSNDTEATLNLPIQGIQERNDSMALPVLPERKYDSWHGLQTGVGFDGNAKHNLR
ncbi:MAG: hypothetical protein Q9186_006128 [Xanthomendoza sp. 1 TL-2023]